MSTNHSNPLFNPLDICRENVKVLSPYTSARDEYVSDGTQMIFLDANENPNENGLNRYPDPLQRSLKQLWSRIKGVSGEQVLFGNGSDEVLDLLFRAFCEPNKDSIITLPPTYGMYQVLAGINGVTQIEVSLKKDFSIDTKAVLKAFVPEAKLLFVCSPNNPTGNLMDVNDVKILLNSFKGLVVVDEAYIDFSEQDSFIKLLDQYPNLVVIQTLSKAYGLAGIRLGVLMASKQIIQILLKIKPPYNVNVLSQQKAAERIEQQSLIKNEVATIIREKLRLETALAAVPFVKTLFSSDANFILARVDNASQRYQELLNKGIVVRNRSKQLHCENTLRFTVGTPQENNTLINTLRTL